MKTTHSFVAPVLNSTQSKVNTEAYEQAIDNYNEGQTPRSVPIAARSPEPGIPHEIRQRRRYGIPYSHGSILVNIRIGEGKLHISADFLELPERGPRRHAASGRRPEHQPADAAALPQGGRQAEDGICARSRRAIRTSSISSCATSAISATATTMNSAPNSVPSAVTNRR